MFLIDFVSKYPAYLVDDVPHALRTRLWRKRDAPLLRIAAADHVCDILVESVDPLAGQRQADALVLEPILDADACGAARG